MPMLDVYAPKGAFSDKHALGQELAETIMRWEKVPAIPFLTESRAATRTDEKRLRPHRQGTWRRFPRRAHLGGTDRGRSRRLGIGGRACTNEISCRPQGSSSARTEDPNDRSRSQSSGDTRSAVRGLTGRSSRVLAPTQFLHAADRR